VIELLNTAFVKVLRPKTIVLYRKALYLFIVVFTGIQLPYAQELWGENALLTIQFYDGSLFFQLFNLLSHKQIAHYYWMFPVALIASCLISFFVKKQQLLSVLILFLYLTIYHRTQAIQNAGADLLKLQLFFLLFMNENAAEMKPGYARNLSIITTNIAFFASQLQVVFVYLIAALFKLTGDNWLSGWAVSYVFENEEYSIYFIKQLSQIFPLALKMITWAVLLFQLLFPVLIWVKKIKPFLLFIGIGMHLGIAFILGIPDFGLLMIIMYLIFCDEAWALKMQSKLNLSAT
jgi:Vitamin K-dependent gamma-carboxylase